MHTTTKAAHTPGPWSLAYDGRTIESSDGRSVSGCVVSRMTEADARLVIAAPDLLAACETSLRWLAKLAADHDGDEIALRAMKQHDNVRAAIAKAEGNA